ncbi:hypothetical protein PHMEG_00014611 [Phytophthora megakarya]|uniref:Uncharacterized protein n=1 Tax=Phytophthora megakarya TaxID=4795 RepID=A0A225W3V9_9STRA|nr:hypothetical protein PHMEG_00014611 [Phytophthora megakarya]
MNVKQKLTLLFSTILSFRVRTKNKVAQRNNRIATAKSKQPKFLEDWVNYGKTFVCTHPGKYKAQGKENWKR